MGNVFPTIDVGSLCFRSGYMVLAQYKHLILVLRRQTDMGVPLKYIVLCTMCKTCHFMCVWRNSYNSSHILWLLKAKLKKETMSSLLNMTKKILQKATNEVNK